METKTYQKTTWEGEFGEEYLKRNIFNPKELDQFYIERYGLSKENMENELLKNIPKSSRILEVGCNIGNQLFHLQSLGFTNLYGIEIQDRAVEYSKNRIKGVNIIKGNALDIPFKDNYFDLVFTNGVLIHISPDNIKSAIKEISRVSNKYIMGLEYYAPTYQEIIYRGEKNLLWKTDFKQLYLDTDTNQKELIDNKYKYLEEDNLIDQFYVLENIKSF